jgi:hypothetical protein
VLKRTEGTGVFSVLSGLDEDYVILWGEMEARIHEFESPLIIAKFLENPQGSAMAGRDYLVIRKDISAGNTITVTNDSVENEIRRMFPVFAAAAMRVPPA